MAELLYMAFQDVDIVYRVKVDILILVQEGRLSPACVGKISQELEAANWDLKHCSCKRTN